MQTHKAPKAYRVYQIRASVEKIHIPGRTYAIDYCFYWCTCIFVCIAYCQRDY